MLTLAVAGCSSDEQTVTVPAYGEHPATTIAAGTPDPHACRNDAVAFADGARLFLEHSGSKAAYPADLYFVIMRGALADFQAHDCDRGVLGRELRRVLTPAERAQLVDGLPAATADAVRESLDQ